MTDAWIYAPAVEQAAQPARVLAELGYAPDQVTTLAARGVVRVAE